MNATTQRPRCCLFRLGFVLLSVWGWACAGAELEGGEPSLWRLVSSIRSFEGRFEQVISNADGLLLEQGSGHMALLRPHYLNWIQEQPERQQVMADGAFVWHHEPALKQVTQSVQDDSLKQTPLGLFWQDEAWLAEHYTINNVTLIPECHQPTCYRIQAIQEGWPTQEVVLGFNAKGQLASLDSLDEMEQRTHLTFKKIYQNGQMSPEEFVWHMPSGVDHVGP